MWGRLLASTVASLATLAPFKILPTAREIRCRLRDIGSQPRVLIDHTQDFVASQIRNREDRAMDPQVAVLGENCRISRRCEHTDRQRREVPPGRRCRLT